MTVIFSFTCFQRFISLSESFGLVVNLTLGGMAMFFIILFLSFVGTKLVVKQSKIKNSHLFSDNDTEIEQIITREDTNYEADPDYSDDNSNKDEIFTISEKLTENLITESVPEVNQSQAQQNRVIKLSNLRILNKLKRN